MLYLALLVAGLGFFLGIYLDPQHGTSDNSTDEEGSEKSESDAEECGADVIDALTFRHNPNVVPTHYDLSLWAKVNAGIFGGTVIILIDIKTDVGPYLYLHVAELKIKSKVTTLYSLQSPIEIKNQCLLAEFEFWVLEVGTLEQGRYELHLDYNSLLGEEALGFYRDTYNDPKEGKDVRFAATQFEPTYARRAFPCFDEPRFKTTFQITIEHDPNFQALCNMQRERMPADGWSDLSKTVCATTIVKMPTYLVAWVISEFTSDEVSHQGVKHRIWSRDEFSDSRDYATSPNALDFMEEFTGMKYPLEKIDSVALPNFDLAGMEHWGLVTFSEPSLLWRPGESNIEGKLEVTETIMHEMAHQWFGNLVTMAFWDEFWLKEGFATWLEHKGTAALNPTWSYQHDFLFVHTLKAYLLDVKENVQPVIWEMETTADILAQTDDLDRIEYHKASCIVRMMEGHLGANLLQKGLRRYLQEFAGETAVTNDLLRSVQEATNKDTNVDLNIYKLWLETPGVPLVEVRRKKKRVTLSQRRFSFDPKNLNNNFSPWPIPMTYFENGKKKTYLLRTKRASCI